MRLVLAPDIEAVTTVCKKNLMRAHAHAHAHTTYTHTYIHTHTHTYIHTHTPHTHTHTYTHTHTHTPHHIYTHIHTHIYIYIHTHTHTQLSILHEEEETVVVCDRALEYAKFGLSRSDLGRGVGRSRPSKVMCTGDSKSVTNTGRGQDGSPLLGESAI